MKTLDSIPTGKIERASKLVKTGVKIGGNYVKYYGKKLVNSDNAKEELDQDNAEDIYDGLKSLKGSALKVAQMLSMEKNLLPRAYVEKFSLSQFSVPPLSAPLVRKTFKKYLDRYPEEVFDHFERDSVNAASIGQVHRAEKNGKPLAVKIQYPGVAESISSDLALVKPIAIKMFNLKGKDSEKYFKEVEHKLIEETNYILELEQSKEITEACSIIPNMEFPKYYPNLSSERILTMDWMKGQHLSEFTQNSFDTELGHKLGQALWDFYMFQIHKLRKVHADPHPGNFLVSQKDSLIAIDFGCIKQIPDEFYKPYFELAQEENINNDAVFMEKLYELEILTPTDSQKELEFFKALFKEMLSLFTSPFHKEEFDFGSGDFWERIADLSERYSKDEQIRKMNGNRGSKHFLYMNRTFFGLFNLLHDLRAKVQVNQFRRYMG
ncbi:ABC1 kinase family protein [Flagellimonas flava]|uniref:Predicted unusual protein kinase regulating ubiquinone biosynthesis, AarF/ABC1/UbiB family n=1 Tax=Flagellimonas flava TaxID=570519 RepID=A0A1M5PLR7_9FLAO|nr:AarF/UbiB family protein [Allomuricauda flava]SHH02479.1 Predicted unusual protein kinase regulating ubiquinone biosynthesis, AarF/ABC1/UbiB family [Allomuricauda flava]